MADENAADQDTLRNQTHDGATDGNDAPSNEDTASEPAKLILGKYKTEDEAIKGHKELERTLHQQAEKLKQLEKESEIKQLLERVVANGDKKDKEETPAPDFDKMIESMAAELTSDPAKGVRKILETNSAWLAEEAKRIREEFGKSREQDKTDLQRLLDRIEKIDPEYAKNSEIIDGLVADGMSLPKAKEWAKKVREMSATPAVERLTPNSSTGGRSTIRETEKRVYLTKADRAQWKSEGYTEEQIDAVEADKQREWSRKGGGK